LNTKLPGRTVALLLVIGCSGTDEVIGPPDGPDGPLTIQSTTPSPNATAAGASDDLFVLFDRALDPATLAPSDVRVFGRWSGVVNGSVSLTDEGRTLRFSPSRPLAAGESVTVTIPRGAIRGLDAAEAPHGFTWTFSVSVTTTSTTFEPVATVEVRNPGEDRIQTYGAYAGALDGDGWSDMIVPNEESNDLRVFMNDGTGGYGSFTIVPVPEADKPSTKEGADFDGDGDIDFAVGSALGSKVAVFHGDGAGGLVHMQNLEAGARVRGFCLWAISNHLVGQAVADVVDHRHQAILPPHVWGDGDPTGVRARAAEAMKTTARAAANMGLEVVNGFTGSPIWLFLYAFPPVGPEPIERGFAEFAALWDPILDVFDEVGVRFALEVPPTEIAFDIVTAERALEAVGYREAFGFNYDPSHLTYQGVDCIECIWRFESRIYHCHMKDVWWSDTPMPSGVFGGHLPFGHADRLWDFRSLGRGRVPFEEIIRALNRVGYQSPLSVEWEDAGMDREHGAAEACSYVRSIDFPPSDSEFDAAFQNEEDYK